MRAIIQTPCALSGGITAPASKSAMQRACAAALIKPGTTLLNNAGVSADDKAALNIIQQLGAIVTFANDNTVKIESSGVQPIADHIHCGESGLSVRMFTSIAALSKRPIAVTGSGSLLSRPLAFFDDVLPQLGVQCTSSNGFLPLQIQGPLIPKDIIVDGFLSSQFITGLFMAYAASAATEVTINVKDLNSKPYIDLTFEVMKAFGLKTPINNSYQSFYFSKDAGIQLRQPVEYTVEGDWSGGAFLLVAAAIGGDLDVSGLDCNSTQADKAILTAMERAEVQFKIEKNNIRIQKLTGPARAFHFDATDCPDLFPPLVALACVCEGTSVIIGVHRLTHKESNRALTLQQEFGKMGVEIVLKDNEMLINGGGKILAAHVSSHHDHRIAMACAVASLAADGETIIEGAEAVNKSYPQFWMHLQQLNVPVTLNDN